MMEFTLSSPLEVMEGVAARMKRRRIDANFTQRELAATSGVAYSTLRLFEETGKASFEAVVKIAFALHAEREFDALFPQQAPRTIEEVIGRPQRQRARRSKAGASEK